MIRKKLVIYISVGIVVLAILTAVFVFKTGWNSLIETPSADLVYSIEMELKSYDAGIITPELKYRN